MNIMQPTISLLASALISTYPFSHSCFVTNFRFRGQNEPLSKDGDFNSSVKANVSFTGVLVDRSYSCGTF